ncbi:MAG: hypothetical protein Q7K39_01445 [Candidatus Magasanikbacteria bacterium]|nr:hypothetical protein [Candidatus Magasanikbacteria bacterium]
MIGSCERAAWYFGNVEAATARALEMTKEGADATNSVKLDFIADQSLHLTGNGKFIFAPVVKLESRSKADVQVGSDDSVAVSGDDVDSEATVSMDLKG